MTDDDSEITLTETIEFARGMVEDEEDSFNGDVPNHAPGLLAARGSDVVQTVTNIKMARASERVDDPTDEQVQNAIVEDAVDILLALGALSYEYDLDIAEAFEERRELVADYEAFEDAMEDVETQEEAIDVVDEHMTEELSEVMGGNDALSGATPIQPGDNVDDKEYDHDGTEKTFA